MNNNKYSDKEKMAAKEILNLQLPHYRKAYSDKTAFLMASLCELSYVVWESRFAGLDKNIADKFQSKVIDKLSNSSNQKFLTDFVISLLKDTDDSKDTLIEDLKDFSLKVDNDISWISDPVTDTQAFIAFNDEYAVLVFRGTEATSIKDIRTDTKARLVSSKSKGLVHEGFQEAFDSVEETINERLKSDQLKDKPLYIAGHSLGGAIATIATRDFKSPIRIAASYTFGSPRVGNEDWINRIKSPVYRLVNAADSVTMLPPGSIPMSGLAFIVGLIPSFGEQIKSWLSKYNGYTHAGNMRYLTNSIPNDHKEVRLLYSVSFLYRIQAVIQHSLFRHLVKDHSISEYRKKLTIIAAKRNKLNIS
jgi:hypothetical protein